MSPQVAIRTQRGSLGLGLRVQAVAAVGAARLLARLPPAGLRRVLGSLSRRGRPADYEQAARFRNAVTSVSVFCAGEGCLPRSVATTLLCRTRGTWPTWCVGVRTAPCAGHAWVEAEGRPVGEPPDTETYRRVLFVAPDSVR